MPDPRLEHSFVDGYPVVRFSGDLNPSSFYTLHLAVLGFSKNGRKPVVIDMSEGVTLSNELGELKSKCRGLFGCPFGSNLVIVSSCENCKNLQELLDLPYKVGYARSVEKAIEQLDETEG